MLRSGMFPAPAHFTESFLSLSFLTFGEKVAVGRAIQAIGREYSRGDLDRITMQQWLEEHGQPPRAIERFWRQVLVSAISEELDRMAAAHGFQVFRLAFLARSDAYEMGVPAVPLGELYRPEAWQRCGPLRHDRIARRGADIVDLLPVRRMPRQLAIVEAPGIFCRAQNRLFRRERLLEELAHLLLQSRDQQRIHAISGYMKGSRQINLTELQIICQTLWRDPNGLASFEIPVDWHLSAGIGHGIDQEGLRHGGEFLARRFGLMR